MKKLIVLIILIFLLPTLALSDSRFRAFDALTGSGNNVMEDIDGDNLAAGHWAPTVTQAGAGYFHYFVVSGSCSTNDSPRVIYPLSCAGDDAENKGYWQLIYSFTIAPTATPGIYGMDSDYADDPVIHIFGNSVDGNDGHVYIKAQVDGSLVTFIDLDGENEYIDFEYDVRTSGTLRSRKRVYDIVGSATPDVIHSGTVYLAGTDGERLILPACEASSIGVYYDFVCVSSGDTVELELFDAEDRFILYGLLMDAGEEIHSPEAYYNSYLRASCLSDGFYYISNIWPDADTSSCTGSGTPKACCTGSGTGDCEWLQETP